VLFFCGGCFYRHPDPFAQVVFFLVDESRLSAVSSWIEFSNPPSNPPIATLPDPATFAWVGFFFLGLCFFWVVFFFRLFCLRYSVHCLMLTIDRYKFSRAAFPTEPVSYLSPPPSHQGTDRSVQNIEKFIFFFTR